MAPRVRSILAGLAGIVTAFVMVATVEAVAHALIPRGAMPSPGDRTALAAYIAAMPAAAFLSIALAWMLAVVAGTLVAVRVARRRARMFALLVGGVIALSALLNFALVPHPAWFIVVGLGAIVLSTLVAMRLAPRLAAPACTPATA